MYQSHCITINVMCYVLRTMHLPMNEMKSKTKSNFNIKLEL